MLINVPQLLDDIKNAASTVLKKDLTSIRGFSERQLKAIAQQAAFVGAGIVSGDITDETRDFFLDNLEDMALNFVNVLRGIIQATIQKLWNAIVAVLWKAIETAAGISLPVP